MASFPHRAALSDPSPPVIEVGGGDQSPPPPSESSPPPPEAAQPPPANASPPPPQSTTSPSPPASPPPPPPTQSQSPSNNTGSSPPSVTNAPPPTNSSSSSPVFSPPPPSRNTSDSPPSRTPPRSAERPPISPPFGEQDTPSPSSTSINAGAIVAIVFAGIVVIAFVLFCVVCTRRKKKRPEYYIDPERTQPKGGSQYYNGNMNWNSPHPVDHAFKLTPPPGVIGGWAATPPPPGDGSSDYSSYAHQTPMPPLSPNMGGFGSQCQFSYEELAAATNGFAHANLLGQGGFGLVHKGVLPSGKEVAVKSLKSGSGQGEREFQAEVEIISRVHHRHLVSLVGYCIAGGQKMLVYEFVPNNTLEFHLHGQTIMDWTTRLRIALGSAKGLAYLHEDCHPRIIHRDIKAANILIDTNFEAMVADFGLAKLTTDNHTHVSTRVMGTFGYLAPEYASSGKLSEKSDVFSFGVMLLELITGRRPVDPHNVMEDSLVDWAKPLLTRAQQEGIYAELVDPRLEGRFVVKEMARMVACAAASIRHSARRRPKMSQIVRALEGDYSLDALNELESQGSVISSNQTSEVYDTRSYDADMVKFRKMVLMTSQEFNSSDYGATSEYGLNPSSSSGESSGKQTPDVRRPYIDQ